MNSSSIENQYRIPQNTYLMTSYNGYDAENPNQPVSNSNDMRSRSCGGFLKKAIIATSVLGLLTGAGVAAGLLIRNNTSNNGRLREPFEPPRPTGFPEEDVTPVIGNLNIENCNAANTNMLIRTHTGVSENIEAILNNPVVTLSAQNRVNLKDCFANKTSSCATYVCADNADSCQSQPRILGYFQPTLRGDNEVYFCLDNLRGLVPNADIKSCELEEVMAHEVAHYIGVPSAPDHNQGPNGDQVYRFGDAANTACQAGFIA